MAFFDRLRRALATPAASARTSGRPTSSNGASSTHARWLDVPEGAQAVSVDLNIALPPSTTDLYFWALQASFATGTTLHGAGHVGLQWISGHPGSTAVNWGGYHQGGGELPGTESTLPSARGNANTRDFGWTAGEAYRLTIERSGADRWLGSVTELTSGTVTPIRELFCAGQELRHIVMWSEVFAACDAPPVEVHWANLSVHSQADPEPAAPSAVGISYQRVEDGGCSNTYTSIDPARPSVVRQRTNTERRNAHGDTLPLVQIR